MRCKLLESMLQRPACSLLPSDQRVAGHEKLILRLLNLRTLQCMRSRLIYAVLPRPQFNRLIGLSALGVTLGEGERGEREEQVLFIVRIHRYFNFYLFVCFLVNGITDTQSYSGLEVGWCQHFSCS